MRKSYVVVNSTLKMKPGKIASQVGHAICSITKAYMNTTTFKEWSKNGEPIIVLSAPESVLEKLLREKYCHPVYDEGLTEVKNGSLTVVGFPPFELSYEADKILDSLKTL
jgi:PTH2 family peptidyl-tRNA hydrolase